MAIFRALLAAHCRKSIVWIFLRLETCQVTNKQESSVPAERSRCNLPPPLAAPACPSTCAIKAKSQQDSWFFDRAVCTLSASPIIIFNSNNVILAEITAGLNLDQF